LSVLDVLGDPYFAETIAVFNYTIKNTSDQGIEAADLDTLANELFRTWKSSPGWDNPWLTQNESTVLCCTSVAFYRHRIAPEHTKIGPITCKSWTCQNCSPHKASETFRHLARIFTDIPEIWVACWSGKNVEEARKRVSKRANRCGASMAIIHRADRVCFFADRQLGGTKAPFFERLTSFNAIRILAASISVPGVTSYGVSISGKWRKKITPGLWRKVTITSLEKLDNARRLLDGLNLDPDSYDKKLLAIVHNLEGR